MVSKVAPSCVRFVPQDFALFSSIKPIKYKYLGLYVELSAFFFHRKYYIIEEPRARQI